MFHGVPCRLGAATLVLQTRPGPWVQVNEWFNLPVAVTAEWTLGVGWRDSREAPYPPHWLYKPGQDPWVQVNEWLSLPAALNAGWTLGVGWRDPREAPYPSHTPSLYPVPNSIGPFSIKIISVQWRPHWPTLRTHVASRNLQSAQVKPLLGIFQLLRGTFPTLSKSPLSGFLKVYLDLRCLVKSHSMETVWKYGFSVYKGIAESYCFLMRV